MAEASEITEVRENTGLAEDDATYTDEVLGALIDANGVNGASAKVWRRIAATYVTATDVTEAGASHKFSDLHKNALAMAASYEKAAAVVIEEAIIDAPRVSVIEREG